MKASGGDVIAVDRKAGEAPVAESTNTAQHIKLAKAVACTAIPLAIWFAPLAVAPNVKAAFAISAFMILAWMTELMEYAAAGLFGLLLFWFFGIAKPDVIFSGFVSDSSWFYLGAMLIGAMATKSGLPQRIGNIVITRVGATYSRLLLGLIIIDFLLTFVVPSGAAVLVIMASITMGVMKLFDAERGSNIGRGLFVAITYTTTIFNKMIIAGTASIMSRSIISQTGGVAVSWGLWFAAFLPTAIVTIFASWWFTLKLFPPEAASLEGRADRVKAHFSTTSAWTPLSVKAAVLSVLALILWMTDWLHGVSASIVAFAAGLFGMLPFVDVLDDLVLLVGRKIIRLSICRPGARLRLRLFPPHGSDQARRAADGGGFSGAGVERRVLLAASGSLTSLCAMGKGSKSLVRFCPCGPNEGIVLRLSEMLLISGKRKLWRRKAGLCAAVTLSPRRCRRKRSRNSGHS